MLGAVEDGPSPIRSVLNPGSRLGALQRNARSGPLALALNQVSRPVFPSRFPTFEPDRNPLKREFVCRRNRILIGECCVVCHEEYVENERIIRLPCKHVFHEHCLMRWLQEHNTCPVCRFELPATVNQSPPPSNVNRGSNAAPTRSPAARGRNANSFSFPGSPLSNDSRSDANHTPTSSFRRPRLDRTPPPRPNPRQSFTPHRQGQQDQNRRRGSLVWQAHWRTDAFRSWNPISGSQFIRQ